MPIPYFLQAMVAHKTTFIDISVDTYKAPLTGILPHDIVTVIGKNRLLVVVLRDH